MYLSNFPREAFAGLLSAALFKHFRRPIGLRGRIIGRLMNIEHVELWVWALKHVSILPNYCILDVGCGGGKSLKIMAQIAFNGKVYGIDYSQDMIQLAKGVNKVLLRRGRIEIVHGVTPYLPFQDNRFDLVTAFEVCYYWLNPVDDLREIKRVLKPSGTLLIACEAYKERRFEKRNAKGVKILNMHLYTPDELTELLQAAGYSNIGIHTIPERNWIAAVGVKR